MVIVRKFIKTMVVALVFVISYCNIALANNWVLIIDQYNQKKNMTYKVWLDTGRTVIHKAGFNPFDYVGDTIDTVVKYEYTINDVVVKNSDIAFTFGIDGKWYSSNGGAGIFVNAFGTFTNLEESFTMKELYRKRDIKIYKAVMKYWNEAIRVNNGLPYKEYTVELEMK